MPSLKLEVIMPLLSVLIHVHLGLHLVFAPSVTILSVFLTGTLNCLYCTCPNHLNLFFLDSSSIEASIKFSKDALIFNLIF